MRIGGIQKLSLMDYPDQVSCVVFTAGCNLKCPFCHNGQLVSQDSSKLSDEDFFNFLDERKNMLDAVVVSGGEPTIHGDLPEFISRIKERGFLVKLDTNGTNPEMVERLVEEELVDYVAVDVKTSPGNYGRVGGECFEQDVLRTVELVKDFEYHEFRTTLAPGVVEKEDLKKISKVVEGAENYFIQEFRPECVLDEDIKFREGFEDLELAETLFEDSVRKCGVRER